jgi:hypothetical protein
MCPRYLAVRGEPRYLAVRGEPRYTVRGAGRLANPLLPTYLLVGKFFSPKRIYLPPGCRVVARVARRQLPSPRVAVGSFRC